MNKRRIWATSPVYVCYGGGHVHHGVASAILTIRFCLHVEIERVAGLVLGSGYA